MRLKMSSKCLLHFDSKKDTICYSHEENLRVSTTTELSSEELASIVPAFAAHFSWVFIAVSYRKDKQNEKLSRKLT